MSEKKKSDNMIEVKAIQKDGTEKVIAKQVLCPPDTPKYNPPWLNERENYLFERGWEKECSANGGLPTYRDPKGSRLNGEVLHCADLPNKGDEMNPTRPLFQLHLPPAFHNFTLEEALAVQTRRDQAGETGETPLERLEKVEIRCNNAETEIKRIKSTIKGLILNKDNQMTLPLLRLKLRNMFGWHLTDEPDDWKV